MSISFTIKQNLPFQITILIVRSFLWVYFSIYHNYGKHIIFGMQSYCIMIFKCIPLNNTRIMQFEHVLTPQIPFNTPFKSTNSHSGNATWHSQKFLLSIPSHLPPHARVCSLHLACVMYWSCFLFIVLCCAPTLVTI
jgi:hypothetical protein